MVADGLGLILSNCFYWFPFWVFHIFTFSSDKSFLIFQVKHPEISEMSSSNIFATKDVQLLIMNKSTMIASSFRLLAFEYELPPIGLFLE